MSSAAFQGKCAGHAARPWIAQHRAASPEPPPARAGHPGAPPLSWRSAPPRLAPPRPECPPGLSRLRHWLSWLAALTPLWRGGRLGPAPLPASGRAGRTGPRSRSLAPVQPAGAPPSRYTVQRQPVPLLLPLHAEPGALPARARLVRSCPQQQSHLPPPLQHVLLMHRPPPELCRAAWQQKWRSTPPACNLHATLQSPTRDVRRVT
mmetsp:Transcript_33063/g.94777  ORF Transcript_33063/g.94777 Transcript_33063/m.94777 type:complete len:206 (+) Transcript_33063:2172-2789(+)